MAEPCVGPCPVEMDAEASFGTNTITEMVFKINLSKQPFKYCRERVTQKEPGLLLSYYPHWHWYGGAFGTMPLAVIGSGDSATEGTCEFIAKRGSCYSG